MSRSLQRIEASHRRSTSKPQSPKS